jgi:hypothetical protein
MNDSKRLILAKLLDTKLKAVKTLIDLDFTKNTFEYGEISEIIKEIDKQIKGIKGE